MTYPHNTVAPVVETIFVEGFKFEICEFKGEQAQKEFGVSKKSRFFLMVEDEYFNLETLENGGKKIGNEIWSIYCADKAHLKSFITEFENKLQLIERLTERALRIKPGIYNSPYNQINDMKANIKKRYGINL